MPQSKDQSRKEKGRERKRFKRTEKQKAGRDCIEAMAKLKIINKTMFAPKKTSR